MVGKKEPGNCVLFFAVASEATSRIATQVSNNVANARTQTSGLVRERSRKAWRSGRNGLEGLRPENPEGGPSESDSLERLHKGEQHGGERLDIDVQAGPRTKQDHDAQRRRTPGRAPGYTRGVRREAPNNVQ